MSAITPSVAAPVAANARRRIELEWFSAITLSTIERRPMRRARRIVVGRTFGVSIADALRVPTELRPSALSGAVGSGGVWCGAPQYWSFRWPDQAVMGRWCVDA